MCLLHLILQINTCILYTTKRPGWGCWMILTAKPVQFIMKSWLCKAKLMSVKLLLIFCKYQYHLIITNLFKIALKTSDSKPAVSHDEQLTAPSTVYFFVKISCRFSCGKTGLGTRLSPVLHIETLFFF